MDDLRYILNEPINIPEIRIGFAHPVTLKEYIYNSKMFNVLQVQMLVYLQEIDVNKKDMRDYVLGNVKDWDVICMDATCIQELIRLLKFIFKLNDDIKIETNWNAVMREMVAEKIISEETDGEIRQIIGFDDGRNVVQLGKRVYLKINEFEINRDNYDILKNSIIVMNRLHFPKIAGDKEGQKWFDKARNAKRNDKDPDMEDILTTIVAVTGIDFDKLKMMTLYQIDKLIARINKIKDFDVAIQYLCVGAEEVKLESYMSHVEDELNETLTVGVNKFKNSMGDL